MASSRKKGRVLPNHRSSLPRPETSTRRTAGAGPGRRRHLRRRCAGSPPDAARCFRATPSDLPRNPARGLRSSGPGCRNYGALALGQGDELGKERQKHGNVMSPKRSQLLVNALLKARELLVELQQLGSSRMFLLKLAGASDTMVPGRRHKKPAVST